MSRDAGFHTVAAFKERLSKRPAHIKEYMQKKMEYTIIGSSLGLLNVVLIDTRFTIVGMGFGILGALYLIKALLINAGKK